MNIYYITQNVNNVLETYHHAIVLAEDSEEARRIHPSGAKWMNDKLFQWQWKYDDQLECLYIKEWFEANEEDAKELDRCWTHFSSVQVTLIGKADDEFIKTQHHQVITSFYMQ